MATEYPYTLQCIEEDQVEIQAAMQERTARKAEADLTSSLLQNELNDLQAEYDDLEAAKVELGWTAPEGG